MILIVFQKKLYKERKQNNRLSIDVEYASQFRHILSHSYLDRFLAFTNQEKYRM